MDKSSWWSSKTVAVVSGGNVGIGLEIVKSFASLGITTVLTARHLHKLNNAVDLLKKQTLHVVSHLLDVTNPISIQEFALWLEKEFGGLDILVNNAGILDESNPRLTMTTNYYGAKMLTEAMLPLFKCSATGPRIVMISSCTSRLDWLQQEAYKWVEKLNNVEKISEQLIDSFIQSFLNDQEQGKGMEKGWPTLKEAIAPSALMTYSVSKMALNAYARMLDRDLRQKGCKLYVNCMCPGLTATPLTRNLGHNVTDAIETAIWLALLPEKECPSGKFFVRRKDVDFVDIPYTQNELFAPSLVQHNQGLTEFINSYVAKN